MIYFYVSNFFLFKLRKGFFNKKIGKGEIFFNSSGNDSHFTNISEKIRTR